MDSLADAAGLLRPLAQQLGLDCSVLFSNTRDLAESDSNVLEIFSSAFGRSLILKEQRIGEKGTQISAEVCMTLLDHGLDPVGLCQGAIMPTCTSQVDDCARFVYQHGGSSLQDLVDTKALSTGERRALMPWVAASVVATLAVLEEQRLVHRDLKLDNIVFDLPTNRVRIIDFGCAAPFHTPTFCGTPGYWPHECFQLVGKPGLEVDAIEEPGLSHLSRHFTSTYDVWCMGLALFKFWGASLPSELGRYSAGAWRRWSAGDWEQLLAQEVPDHPEVREFLMAALQPDPEARWSASQLLEHPLIKDLMAQVHQQWAKHRDSDIAERAATARRGKCVLLLREAGMDLPMQDKRNMQRFEDDYGVTAYPSIANNSKARARGSDTTYSSSGTAVDSSSEARNSSSSDAADSSDALDSSSDGGAAEGSSDEADCATPQWVSGSPSAGVSSRQQESVEELQQQLHTPLQQQQQQPVYWASKWQQQMLQRNGEAEAQWAWTRGLHEAGAEAAAGAWVCSADFGTGAEASAEFGARLSSTEAWGEGEAWAWTRVLHEADAEGEAGAEAWAWYGAEHQQQQQQGPCKSARRCFFGGLKRLAGAAAGLAVAVLRRL